MHWDWNDLRYFLAVARTGTTTAAARRLGVNQTTCARRIAVLERGLGAQLFERSAAGYALTALGQALVGHAEQAEAAADSFASTIAQAAPRRSPVRLSTSDFIAHTIAEPAIAALARDRPDVAVELLIESRAVDLLAGEADVALRGSDAIGGEGLVCRKLVATPWAVYRGRNFDPGNEPLSDIAACLRHPIATLAGRPSEMLRALDPAPEIRFTTNSLIALAERVTRGDCLAAMPIQVENGRADLIRCFDLVADTAVWIVYPERLRADAEVRALIDALVAQVTY